MWSLGSIIPTLSGYAAGPIARGLLIAMGGKIWVESKEGQGSTFVLELPVAASGAVAAAPERVTA